MGWSVIDNESASVKDLCYRCGYALASCEYNSANQGRILRPDKWFRYGSTLVHSKKMYEYVMAVFTGSLPDLTSTPLGTLTSSQAPSIPSGVVQRPVVGLVIHNRFVSYISVIVSKVSL